MTTSINHKSAVQEVTSMSGNAISNGISEIKRIHVARLTPHEIQLGNSKIIFVKILWKPLGVLQQWTSGGSDIYSFCDN